MNDGHCRSCGVLSDKLMSNECGPFDYCRRCYRLERIISYLASAPLIFAIVLVCAPTALIKKIVVKIFVFIDRLRGNKSHD